MSWQDIALILALVPAILTFCGLSAQRLANLIWSHRRAIWRVYYTIATSLLTLYLFYLFFFVFSKRLFSGEWALVVGAVLYWVILLWLSFLSTRRFWHGWLTMVPIVVTWVGIVAILVGFWIVRWPEGFIWPDALVAPLVLTFLLLIALLIYLADGWFRARRSR